MAVKKEIKINVNTKEATKGVDDVTDSIESASSATSGLSGQLDKMTGGAFSAFKGIKSGVKSGITAMKSLKVAIAATGIGLLVVAVGALTAAFRGSEEGQNKLAKIMSVIGVLTGNLIDLIADLGDGIIKAFENPKEALQNFANAIKDNITNRITGLLNLLPNLGKSISLVFQGKFKEAGKTAANAVGQVVLGVENVTDSVKKAGEALSDFAKQNLEEAKQGAQVADMRAKADKIERNLIVERSKLESEIAALRLKSRQEEEFSAEQRKQALLDAQELEDSLLEKETEYLTLRAEAQSLENTFARSNKENLDAEANAIAAVNRMQASRLNQQRQTQRELNRLNKEIQSEQTALAKEKTAAEQEAAKAASERAKAEADAKQKILEATLEAQNLEVMKAQQKYDALIAEAKKYGLDETELVKAKNAEINSINKKYYDQDAKNKQDAEIAKLQIVAGTLGALGKLAGEQTQAGKALSAAEAIINTYTGATKALAQGGIAGPIAAAGVIATGLASVRAIYATEVPNTASVGANIGGRSVGANSGAPAVSLPTPTTPRIGFDSNGANLGNQIAESLAKTPVRAYVVSQEVQSAAQMDRKIRETATIG
jgi:chemotaxis protein histidine kinase CheA